MIGPVYVVVASELVAKPINWLPLSRDMMTGLLYVLAAAASVKPAFVVWLLSELIKTGAVPVFDDTALGTISKSLYGVSVKPEIDTELPEVVATDPREVIVVAVAHVGADTDPPEVRT